MTTTQPPLKPGDRVLVEAKAAYVPGWLTILGTDEHIEMERCVWHPMSAEDALRKVYDAAEALADAHRAFQRDLISSADDIGDSRLARLIKVSHLVAAVDAFRAAQTVPESGAISPQDAQQAEAGATETPEPEKGAEGCDCHRPCCSAHAPNGAAALMDCERYRRTHFVQAGPCCEHWPAAPARSDLADAHTVAKVDAQPQPTDAPRRWVCSADWQNACPRHTPNCQPDCAVDTTTAAGRREVTARFLAHMDGRAPTPADYAEADNLIDLLGLREMEEERDKARRARKALKEARATLGERTEALVAYQAACGQHQRAAFDAAGKYESLRAGVAALAENWDEIATQMLAARDRSEDRHRRGRLEHVASAYCHVAAELRALLAPAASTTDGATHVDPAV